MATNDEKYLLSLTKEVIKKLKNENLPPPFSLNSKPKIHIVNSGGWRIKVGYFRGYQCSAEIWFDHFTSHEKRKIYYCVFSRKSRGIRRLIAASKSLLGEHIPIGVSDWSGESNIIKLDKPFRKKDFGMPVFENYPARQEYLYGIYEYERLGLQRNETRRMIERITEFIYSINENLSKENLQRNADTYQGIENRKSVQRHIQRERKSHLAVMRKHQDDYVCQICGFDYVQKYGHLGEDFAEAHHIVPLAKNDKERKTTIDDLITVCADCHRMLHRMKGEAGDIAKLKKIVKQNRQHR